jgi:hypothetical protein
LLIKISKKFRSQKTNPIKAHSLPGSGRGWFIIRCVCWVYLQTKLTRHSMASSSTRRQILQQELDLMEIDAPSQKRLTDKDETSRAANGKKNKPDKPTIIVSVPDQRPPRYWLGFSYMEQIAIDRNLPECTNSEPLEDLMTKGYTKTEAEEMLQAIVAFPRVPQILYPTAREDQVLGQHYNLTQIPFEVEVHPDTGLSLDFHVTIFFERPQTAFGHDEILDMALKRFEEMKIPLGTNIRHPISILCKHTKTREEPRIWVGILKVHLLQPEVHGIDLLRGVRPFILRLDDNALFLGKIAKGYDTVAKNNLLSVKFTSKSLEGITTHSLFKEVLEDSFERRREYEITGVQKSTAQDFAWIVAPTPNQAKKIREYKIRAQQEVLQGVVTKAEATRKRNATPEQRAKRDCLKLVVYNLPPTKTTEMIAHAIKEKMGEKNVVDIFFHNSDGEKHSGKANIECLSPIVYRQYLDKTIAMLGKYIEFTPHPRSLEGTAPPTEEDIKKFGFCDNNQALVDTLEAVQNAPAPSSSVTKEDIVAIVEGAIENGNKRLKMEMHKEMDSLKETMVEQANTYAEQLTDNLKTELEDVKNALEIALAGLRNKTQKKLTTPTDQPNPQ